MARTVTGHLSAVRNGHGRGGGGNGKAGVLPHSIEAEQAVLGAVLLDADAYADVAEWVGPDDFYHPAHQEIWRAISALVDEMQPVDLVTVSQRLGERLAAVGGATYLAQLAHMVPTAANAAWYARQVREYAIRRQVARRAREIYEAAVGGSELDEVREIVERTLLDAAGVAEQQEIQRLGDVVRERLAHAWATRDQANPEGIPTGFVDLDDYTGGLPRGGLTILAARPSVGKSTMALILCENAARAGYHVYLYSAEMSGAEIADRVVARRADINTVRIRRRRLTDDEWQRAFHVVQQIGDLPLWVDTASALTVAQVRSRVRRLHARHRIDLVVVDYLQYLHDEAERRGNVTRAEIVGAMGRRMKVLAREIGAAVLCVAQLNRAPEMRADRRPRLADLRESGQLEQDADLVLLLHRPEMHNPQEKPGVMECEIAKHRNGPTGLVELQFDARRVAVRDLYRQAVGGHA